MSNRHLIGRFFDSESKAVPVLGDSPASDEKENTLAFRPTGMEDGKPIKYHGENKDRWMSLECKNAR
jgi:hypothetical protein